MIDKKCVKITIKAHFKSLLKKILLIFDIRKSRLSEKSIFSNKRLIQDCAIVKMSISVDGIWSTWSQWSACTHTCGSNSTHQRSRSCDSSPAPQGNGTHCPGPASEMKQCQVSPCPGTVMRIIELKIVPVPVRLHFGYGIKLIFVIISPFFAIFKNVVHTLEPGETPSYSASYQTPYYAQRS